MWLLQRLPMLIPLIMGIVFIAAGLASAIDACRTQRGLRRLSGILGGILLAAGAAGFFSLPLASTGIIPASFEWPVGWATQIIQLPDQRRIVTHEYSGRIQIYDQNWRFVRAWIVDPRSGKFKAKLSANGLIEVWEPRTQRHLFYQLDGRIVEDTKYDRASIPPDFFSSDGTDGLVPTSLPLWVFTHPAIAWGTIVAGVALLFLGKRQVTPRIPSTPLTEHPAQPGANISIGDEPIAPLSPPE